MRVMSSIRISFCPVSLAHWMTFKMFGHSFSFDLSSVPAGSSNRWSWAVPALNGFRRNQYKSAPSDFGLLFHICDVRTSAVLRKRQRFGALSIVSFLRFVPAESEQKIAFVQLRNENGGRLIRLLPPGFFIWRLAEKQSACHSFRVSSLHLSRAAKEELKQFQQCVASFSKLMDQLLSRNVIV